VPRPDERREDPLRGDRGDFERGVEEKLQPSSLDEFVSQDELRANLRVFVQAARERGSRSTTCSTARPPGPTALAHVIARDGAPLRVTAGPVIERAGDPAAILTNPEPGGVLQTRSTACTRVEEIPYPAMKISSSTS
jgi:Holliday junction DNA helicase RuvB